MCAMQITDATFESEVINSTLPVLVDFWAPWCGPCRAIAPVLDELSEEFKDQVKIVKVNVDENNASPVKYGIKAIPTLILFKNGEIVEQVTGGSSKASLAELITKKALS